MPSSLSLDSGSVFALGLQGLVGHHRDLGLMSSGLDYELLFSATETPHLGCLSWTEDAALAKLAQHDGERQCLFSP